MSAIRAVVLFLFRLSRFVAIAVEHDTELEFSTNKQLHEAYPDHKLPPERQKLYQDSTWYRGRKIRESYGKAFLLVEAAMVLGWVSGILLYRVVGPVRPFVVGFLQLISA